MYAKKTLGKIPEMDQLLDGFVKVHKGSMKLYCEYISIFKKVYDSSIGSKGNKINRLNQGLSKLK